MYSTNQDFFLTWWKDRKRSSSGNSVAQVMLTMIASCWWGNTEKTTPQQFHDTGKSWRDWYQGEVLQTVQQRSRTHQTCSWRRQSAGRNCPHRSVTLGANLFVFPPRPNTAKRRTKNEGFTLLQHVTVGEWSG